MIERDFEGVWFPRDLYLCRKISFQEKAFLIEIKSLSVRNPQRGCYANNRHFAEQFDLSVSRVSEIITGLSRSGLLVVRIVRSGKEVVDRNIFLTPKALEYWIGTPFGKGDEPPSEKAGTPFGKGDEPPSEKAQDKSTNSNSSNEEKKNVGEGKNSGNDLFGNQLPDESLSTRNFEEFWSLWPRKADGKGEGRKAFDRALKKARFQTIMDGLRAHLELWEMRDRTSYFIANTPLVTTWLNKERWNRQISGEIENAKRGTVARGSGKGPTGYSHTDALLNVGIALGALSENEHGGPGYGHGFHAAE